MVGTWIYTQSMREFTCTPTNRLKLFIHTNSSDPYTQYIRTGVLVVCVRVCVCVCVCMCVCVCCSFSFLPVPLCRIKLWGNSCYNLFHMQYRYCIVYNTVGTTYWITYYYYKCIFHINLWCKPGKLVFQYICGVITTFPYNYN